MAKSESSGIVYAIKFFVSQEAFEAESKLYSAGSGPEAHGLAQFLPLVCLYFLFFSPLTDRPTMMYVDITNRHAWMSPIHHPCEL